LYGSHKCDYEKRECARNEADDGNAGGRREGAEVCDTFWGVEKPVLVSGNSGTGFWIIGGYSSIIRNDSTI